MKRIFNKITPDREKIENSKMLKPIAHLLGNPRIWHFNRRTVIAGISIGLFFGSIPIVGQMLLAAFVAIAMRVNMPVAVVFTWISNPVTMPFFYTANYYFGAWLMGREPLHLEEIDLTWEGLLNLGGDILVPLFFGSIVVGVILSSLSYIIMRAWWRLHVVAMHKARQSRYKKALTKGKPDRNA